MFCRKCGRLLSDHTSFCTACGTAVVSVAGTPDNPPLNQMPVNRPVIPGAPPIQAGGYYPSAPQDARRQKRPLLIALLVGLGIFLLIIPVILISALLADPDNGGVVSTTRSDEHKPTAAATTSETASTTEVASTTAATRPTEDQTAGFRDNYTKIQGGGRDTYTLMIYICGSDLESGSGSASADIKEIIAADLGDKVNVVLQTGGCANWKMNGIKDGAVQRWLVKDGRLVKLQDLGKTNMLTAAALGDFISFAADQYPASRKALIFWDHGGGSLYGFGSDELYPDDCLYLPNIAEALSGSGVQFDFVGFDACLMGSIETAFMLEPYADYLIASEDTEPSLGWNYTPWLTALGQNTSITTIKLGKKIVDSYITQNNAASTLSVISLREIPHVYELLGKYMSNAATDIAGKAFSSISVSVSNTKSFADGNYDMIDLVDFTNQSEIEGEAALVGAVKSAVKYRNACSNKGVYGLSMYFPYTNIAVYGYSKEMFAEFGFGGALYEFYDTFVSILAGGQTKSNSQSLQENLTGEANAATDYSSFDWYDASAVENYVYDSIDYTRLEIFYDETNSYYYLPLSAEDWELITTVEMQILLDDGEGYINLGSDQYFKKDAAGNLILDYGNDNTWIAIGGQVVCYFAEDIIETDQGNIFIGYVPAVLNDATEIEIILEWDGEEAEGFIAGYRLAESNSAIGGEGTAGKGYMAFNEGDVIKFLCDYYTYDGKFDANYFFGNPLTIGKELPAITSEDVGDSPVRECYMLVDIYQNYAWTESVEFK